MFDRGGTFTYLLGKDIQRILTNQEIMMATLQELKDVVAQLRTAVVDDNTADAATVASLQATIDRLTADAANGITPTDVDSLITELTDIKTNISPAIPVPATP